MQQTYPLLTARIQSTFIDLLVIITLMFSFSAILDHVQHVPDWVTIALMLSLLAYEPICTSVGCTLGNYIKKISVRKADDPSKRINIIQAVLRYIVKLLLGWISFLTINSNEKRRAIHDLVAGTVMVDR